VESVGALLAALLLQPAGAPLTVVPTTRRTVARPAGVTELVDRLPDGHDPAGQVRIERYDGADGTRWIVYIAGTVTFARDSGDEPFDLASDVLGVAHRPGDSERAVLQAMRSAGIADDEPVLLVGHSQGALDAVRVAEDGGYAVGGVVQLGGPTGQIALPDDVPVLAVEHDEDLVAVLGGTAAPGSAGLRRLVVRRSLPDGGFGVPTSAATAEFPAHDLGAYRRTLVAAEASGDERVLAFTHRIGGFLEGEQGTATRWRARRVSPEPVPTAAGGADRRSSR
jgi:pimeloyl-ACP methyl ester carboxylesterase